MPNPPPPRSSWRDLAVLGGAPLFPSPLHVNKPNVPDRKEFHARLDGMLDRRWYSDGILVEEFERRIAEIAGTRHCVATCNGTIAIEIAMRALGVEGEVIVPSFTFYATAQALRWLGLVPVYCDVDPGTHGIDPDRAASLVGPRTGAILGVHLWGGACDVERLEALAERHGVTLVLDAAQALGSTVAGRPVGGFGSAEIFSFQATKFISTGEGGAVTTDDDGLARRLRAGRDLGFDASDRVIGPGTNGKMSELSAALGLTFLSDFDGLMGANAATVARYRTGLEGVPGVAVFDPGHRGRTNDQFVVTTIDEERTGISRDGVLAVLRAEGILAKPYFSPGCHVLDPDRGGAGEPAPLPVTEHLARVVLVLPGGASVSAEEVDVVCRTLATVVAHGEEIAAAMAASAPA